MGRYCLQYATTARRADKMIMQKLDVLQAFRGPGYVRVLIASLLSSTAWASPCSWVDVSYDSQIALDYQHLEESSRLMRQALAVLPEDAWRVKNQRCNGFVERVRQGRYPN